MFVDKKCTVYSSTLGMEDWEQVRSTSILYENIPCEYYRIWYKSEWQKTKEEKEKENQSWEVVLSWIYKDVREGQLIELIDPDLWSQWKYIINPLPSPHRKLDWTIDNIVLSVSPYTDV